MPERERFALELELHRAELAADGGDGHIGPGSELHPPTMDVEWMLRGPLLEAMAAVVLGPNAARNDVLEEPEVSGAVAE